MKINLSNVLTVLAGCFFILFAVPAIGQEESGASYGYSENSSLDQRPDDKITVFEQENKAPRVVLQSNLRDSVTNRSAAKPKVPGKPDSGKEEDALSFNFLYYIIQKYKFSDIIDQ
ncbi:MAG: hypothetical protein HC811_00795 [Flammeovirgaceae bacterium]|nr:hypothetical protein [Flammeovirgaceae bacterium]